MGATSFFRIGRGKTANEAYTYACDEAQDERGHQHGYSGDLNSKHGYALVTPPAGVDVKDWMGYLQNGELPDSLKQHQAKFDRQFEIYDDKWESALCFDLGAGRFAFLGYAPE